MPQADPWDEAVNASPAGDGWDKAVSAQPHDPWDEVVPEVSAPKKKKRGVVETAIDTFKPIAPVEAAKQEFVRRTVDSQNALYNLPPEPEKVLMESPLQAQMAVAGITPAPTERNMVPTQVEPESLGLSARRAARFITTAPFEMGAQIAAEQFGSPAGIATLPFVPLKVGAKLGLGGARSLAGLALKGTAKGVGIAGEAAGGLAMKGISKIAPEGAIKLKQLGAKFSRPDELVNITRASNMALQAEREAIGGFIEATAGKIPEAQMPELLKSVRATQEEAVSGLKRIKAEAESVVPAPMGLRGEIGKAERKVGKTHGELEQFAEIAPEGVDISPLERPFAQALAQRENAIRLVPAALQDRAVFMARAKEIKAQSLAEFAGGMPKESRQLLIEEAKKKGFNEASPEIKALGDEIFARMQTYADRQVAAGIPKEAFQTLEGVYLPQLYTGTELAAKGRGILGTLGRARVTGERMKERVVQSAETAEKLGAAEAPVYTLTKAELQESYDSSVAEMMKNISDVPTLASDTAIDPSWVKMADSPKFGALANKFVHPSVAYELSGPQIAREGLEGGLNRAIGRIKSAVTIWNPPVHFGNTISNAILMDFAGVPVSDMSVIRNAIKSFKAEDDIYKKIAGTGLVSKRFQYNARELDGLLDEALSVSADNKAGQDWALEHLANILVKGPKSKWNPAAMYQAEEQLGKYITAHYAMTKGIAEHGIAAGDALAAARHAEKWLFNYGDLPVGFKELRGSGAFGLVASPFVTFPLKVTPLMAESLVRQPHKFVKWHAALTGWNNAARKNAGVSDSEWSAYRQAKIDQAAGTMDEFFARIAPEMVLPFKTGDDKFYAVSVSRFTPWGAIQNPAQMLGGFATNPLLREMNMGRPVGALGQGTATETFGGKTTEVGRGARIAGQYARTAASPILPPPVQRAIGAVMAPYAKVEYNKQTGLPGPNAVGQVMDTLGMPFTSRSGERISPVQQALAMALASPYKTSRREAEERALSNKAIGASELRKSAYRQGARIMRQASGSPQSSEGPPPQR